MSLQTSHMHRFGDLEIDWREKLWYSLVLRCMSIKIVGQLLRLRFKYIRDSLSIRRKLFDKNYQDMDKENHDYGFKAQTEIGQVFKLHFFFKITWIWLSVTIQMLSVSASWFYVVLSFLQKKQKWNTLVLEPWIVLVNCTLLRRSYSHLVVTLPTTVLKILG